MGVFGFSHRILRIEGETFGDYLVFDEEICLKILISGIFERIILKVRFLRRLRLLLYLRVVILSYSNKNINCFYFIIKNIFSVNFDKTFLRKIFSNSLNYPFFFVIINKKIQSLCDIII